MTRSFDFVLMGVIWIVAIVVHMMGVELFSPGTPLYEMASTGTEAMNGAERAQLWYEVLTVWVPMIAAGGITFWSFVREYRRQAVTSAARPR